MPGTLTVGSSFALHWPVLELVETMGPARKVETQCPQRSCGGFLYRDGGSKLWPAATGQQLNPV
eukprot:11676003-Alexandrium_andersonii.AAC.1